MARMIKKVYYELKASKSEARKIIEKTLAEIKSNGDNYIDVLGLHAKTKLPYPQINRGMDQLEKEGKVRERV